MARQLIVEPIQSPVDSVKPLIDSIQSPIDSVEPLIDSIQSPVDTINSGIQSSGGYLQFLAKLIAEGP